MKIKIVTHSGSEYTVEIETYDPIQMNSDLNNREINTVAFGEIILSRIDVKAVVPIQISDETFSEPIA